MAGSVLHSAWRFDDGLEGASGEAGALFPLWSFGKTILSICALRLVEEGRLALDEPLAGRPFTLRQLLMHTAGVPNYGRLAAYHEAVAAGEPAWPRDRLLEAIGPGRLLFPPGEGWAYSNIGYLYVRELIEAVDGRPFEAIVDELAASVGAPSIRLAATQEAFSRVLWPAARGYDPGWVYHGCLIGTAPDAARLLHALFAGRILRPGTVEQMIGPRPLGGPLEGRPWATQGYALGLMSGETKGAGRATGHSGGGPFCVNAVCHFPDVARPVTVAVFTDGTDEGVAEWEAVRIATAG